MSTLLARKPGVADAVANKLLWLVPPAAALVYPYAVKAFYLSGQLLQEAPGGPSYVLAWLTVIVSATLTYGVPAVALAIAYVLGKSDACSTAQLRARRFAHLTVAAPSLFVLIGVIFYLLRVPNGDYVFWWVLWLAIVASVAWSTRSDDQGEPAAPRAVPGWLRMSHGFSALAILLGFLAWHLLNHMVASGNIDHNLAMMKVLRKWYRSELVQPVLVALLVFQVVSGLILLWAHTAVRADGFRTLQTATGAFLSVFIVSHLNAVFILGRTVSGVDTTFLWAAGSPTGLLPDPWNVRLIPHYSLGVWFVITHMGLGLREVLLAHRVRSEMATRVAWGISVLGVVVALIITSALMSVHGAR